MMLRYLLEKEVRQMKRNPFIPKVIVMMPVMMLLVMPWAATMDVRDLNVAVVDNDRSTYSQQLIEQVEGSSYFIVKEISPSFDEAMKSIEHGATDLILEIPDRWEEQLMTTGTAQVLISANTVNGTRGGLGSSYLASLISDYGATISPANTSSGGVRIYPQYRYNPALSYRRFMVPALLTMLLTVMCGFMPTLNIVSEKEKGTIEQMNVSPVPKWAFILSKLIPYWVIGLFVITFGFVIAYLLYGLIPAGNILIIYFSGALYILLMSGFGLIVSNYSSTMQQAMFVMFFFIMVIVLMSGLFTPVSGMPVWAQYIAACNPLTYFIRIMRSVYLKGSSFVELLPSIGWLFLFTLLFCSVAVVSYRKSSK